MSLFKTKSLPVSGVPTPAKAQSAVAETVDYVTREQFDTIVDALLTLIAEAAYSSDSGGFREDSPEYRFSRHADTPLRRRVEAALARVRHLDQEVHNERARHRRV